MRTIRDMIFLYVKYHVEFITFFVIYKNNTNCILELSIQL